MQNDPKQTVTMTTKEVPVISYNDMAFISERNSIVFRAGDSPVWNRNEMILPMSWRLFSNTIVHAGHDYSLQTIPTLSSALDFDVRKNQPDFMKMLNKRIEQSTMSEPAKIAYQQAYGYSDYEIEQLDPDNYADEIMTIINNYLRKREEATNEQDENEFEMDFSDDWMGDVEENTEQLQANAEAAAQQSNKDQKRYAGNMLSREDLVSSTSGVNHSLDKDIIESYLEVKRYMWNDTTKFVNMHGDLYGLNSEPYIIRSSTSEDLAELQKAAEDKDSKVYSEGKINEKDLNSLGSYEERDAFYRFLVSLDRWAFAKGRFDT
jgi:chromosome segregation ATPase